MSAFLLNILLALAWLALTGTFSPANLILGFAIGYVLLWFCMGSSNAGRYFVKLRIALRFALFFLWQLTKANFKVAFDVLTPRHHMKPGVIAVPLDVTTDAEITMLANLITLTPGTLSLDVSTDRKVLYVHAMYIEDADSIRREIKEGFERRILDLLR